MELDEAVKGMMAAREQLRSKQGVDEPDFISRQMQRLAQYTAAVEEHLGQLEEEIELEEARKFMYYTKEEGKSPNQASLFAKQSVAPLKGQIAKLKRYCLGSWQIVGVAQSRWNHIAKQNAGQI